MFSFNNDEVFENIKHTNEFGQEFWYARELQPVLEYSQWRRFAEAIERAKTACEKSGHAVSEHFANVGKSSAMPNGGNMTNEQILEYFRTAVNFSHDCENVQKCYNSLQFFNREHASSVISTLTNEYATEINIFGNCADGIHVNHYVNFDLMSDDQIKWQLQYLGNHIPIYALMKKGEEELAKQLANWINGDNS